MFRASLAAALLAFASTAALPAQQILYFAIAGNSPASGIDWLGQQSLIRVSIHGQGEVTLLPPAGHLPGQLASALHGALASRGYSASLLPGNVVSVYRSNLGFLDQGGTILCTDSGLAGVSCGVREGTPARPQLVPNKRAGGTIPNLAPGVAAYGGTITILAEVERPGPAGGIQRDTVTVQVPVARGDNSTRIDTRTVNALVAAGLRVRFALIQSVLDPNLIIPAMGIDRDLDGNPVRKLTYLPQLPPDLVHAELTAGAIPLMGATNYGRDFNGSANHLPIIETQLLPMIGIPLEVQLETRSPGRLAGVLVGLRAARLPVPFLAPGAHLLVDPLAVLDGVTDRNGDMFVWLPIPFDPAMIGFTVYFQGLDLSFFGGDMRFSDGLAVRLGI